MLKKLLRKLIELVVGKTTAPNNDTPKEINYSELKFSTGGFHGENAQQVEGCEIANLNVKPNGMSYSWLQGGCEMLGASDRTDASKTIACLFCLIGGKWLGGKFDWISTSRTTRDFKNIATGYHGWDAAAIDKAEAYRFVVVSKDGKKRTNVIEVMR